MADRPAFLITIDTEGDNLWSRPRDITTRNTAYLPRFQSLCERHGLKPTWLANYEMAMDPAFVAFGRDVEARNAGEIGMHLHAWNSPPLVPLTSDDYRHQPFLIEYPEPVIREKVARLTGLLRERFGGGIVGHRAGRWSFNAVYARILIEQGYTADCSVTPSVSWKGTWGNPPPRGEGGTDYTTFPEFPYFVDPADISRSGRSALLEVPMTTRAPWRRLATLPVAMQSFPGVRRLLNRRAWLRPKGDNLNEMLGLVRRAAREQWPHLMFMLHSSEFMPGGSPTFCHGEAIERLYEHLEQVFDQARRVAVGMTLREYRSRWHAVSIQA